MTLSLASHRSWRAGLSTGQPARGRAEQHRKENDRFLASPECCPVGAARVAFLPDPDLVNRIVRGRPPRLVCEAGRLDPSRGLRIRPGRLLLLNRSFRLGVRSRPAHICGCGDGAASKGSGNSGVSSVGSSRWRGPDDDRHWWHDHEAAHGGPLFGQSEAEARPPST